jgi:uncharacterized membrane protein YeaQ/YmgE (transglycosylase-associated protein family)
LPVTGLGTGRHDGPVCGLPAEAAAPVHESAGAGLAVASGLGHAGAGLADAVRHAFAVGMHYAMLAAAAVAVLGAVVVAWRAPGRTPTIIDRPAVAGAAELAPVAVG